MTAADDLAALVIDATGKAHDTVSGLLGYIDEDSGPWIYEVTDAPEDLFGPPESLAGKRAGALATRVQWSPDPAISPVSAWSIVAVCSGHPAVAFVGPYEGEWFELFTYDMPWFVASTAGAIRKAIEEGAPLSFKNGTDPRLLGRVGDGFPPPEDENGLI